MIFGLQFGHFFFIYLPNSNIVYIIYIAKIRKIYDYTKYAILFQYEVYLYVFNSNIRIKKY